MVIQIKRIIKKLLLVVVVSFIFSKGALAATYQEQIYKGSRVSGVYVTKKHDGRTWHDYINILNRRSDGHWVYCIQPGVSIDSEANYIGTDQDLAQATKLTNAQISRVELLAYYGYSYNENGYNHSANKWYAVTQFLIWQTIGSDWNIYFTDGLGGPKLESKYITEITELETLVANHNQKPDFGAEKFRIDLNSAITLIDQNGVLNNYTINYNPETITLGVDGNNLTIKAHESGKSTIELIKSTKKWNTSPLVYINPESQNVFMIGNFTPIKTLLEIESFSGQIIIEKTGETVVIEDGTYSYQEILLSDVVFGLYDENDNLFESGSTDNQGLVVFKNLKLGERYYIKEISSSNGNLIDSNRYYCFLEEPEKDSYITTTNFYLKNYLPKGTLEFTKVDEESGNSIPDTTIEIYTDLGELIYTGITDANGQIIIKDLYTGLFYIKETVANPSYYLSEEIINFMINNETITQVKMNNLKIPVPNTGFDILDNNYLLNTISFLGGPSLIINDKKRKK